MKKRSGNGSLLNANMSLLKVCKNASIKVIAFLGHNRLEQSDSVMLSYWHAFRGKPFCFGQQVAPWNSFLRCCAGKLPIWFSLQLSSYCLRWFSFDGWTTYANINFPTRIYLRDRFVNEETRGANLKLFSCGVPKQCLKNLKINEIHVFFPLIICLRSVFFLFLFSLFSRLKIS